MPKVRIYIMRREYGVPSGLTIMAAMEYTGYKFVRGAWGYLDWFTKFS